MTEEASAKRFNKHRASFYVVVAVCRGLQATDNPLDTVPTVGGLHIRLTERHGMERDSWQRSSCDILVSCAVTSQTGVEIDHLALGSGREIQLREIGSTLRAMWPAYFAGCRYGILVGNMRDSGAVPSMTDATS